MVNSVAGAAGVVGEVTEVVSIFAHSANVDSHDRVDQVHTRLLPQHEFHALKLGYPGTNVSCNPRSSALLASHSLYLACGRDASK